MLNESRKILKSQSTKIPGRSRVCELVQYKEERLEKNKEIRAKRKKRPIKFLSFEITNDVLIYNAFIINM